MVLRSGSFLGQYEILEQLGAGGMGEVYRARDLRLGREEAVKILPTHVTAIYRIDLTSGTRMTWRHISPPDSAGIILAAPTAITPDGRAYTYSYMRILGDLFVASGIR